MEDYAFGLIAMVISLISAFFLCQTVAIAGEAKKTADQTLEETRKHNRLSVVPNLIIDCKIVTTEEMFVLVRSGGLGPGRILGFKYLFDGRPYTKEDPGKLNIRIQTIQLEPGESIIQGEEKDLMVLISRSDQILIDRDDEQNFIEFLKKLKIEIEYASFYGEKQEPARFDGPNTII